MKQIPPNSGSSPIDVPVADPRRRLQFAMKMVGPTPTSAPPISQSMEISVAGDSPSRSSVPEAPDLSPPGSSIDEQDIICDKNGSILEQSEPLVGGEPEIVSVSEDVETKEEEKAEEAVVECSSSDKCSYWGSKDDDAPEVPEGFIEVEESKFPIRVKEFFDLFFSDDSINFQESFHRKCGDEEFNCTSWVPNENFEHTRNVSFHHPTNPYYFPKFEICHETQKYRIYRNCHLVVDTSQETNAAAGYFNVEGHWDVVEDSNDSQPGCVLRVYTNVAFSKSTKWDGHIERYKIRECTGAYATWIDLAHEVLKQKNLNKEKVEQVKPDVNHPPEGSVGYRYRCGIGFVFDKYDEFWSNFVVFINGLSTPSLLLGIAVLMIVILTEMSIINSFSRPQNYTSNLNETTVEAATLNRQIKYMEEETEFAETMLHLREAAATSLNRQIKYLEEEMELAKTMLNLLENEHGRVEGKLVRLKAKLKKFHVLRNERF